MIKAPSLSSESSHHHLSRSGCSADGHVLHKGGHDVHRDWEHDCAVVLRGDVVQRLKKIIMIPLANAYQNQQKEKKWWYITWTSRTSKIPILMSKTQIEVPEDSGAGVRQGCQWLHQLHAYDLSWMYNVECCYYNSCDEYVKIFFLCASELCLLCARPQQRSPGKVDDDHDVDDQLGK